MAANKEKAAESVITEREGWETKTQALEVMEHCR